MAAALAAGSLTLAGGVPRVLLAAGSLPDQLRPFVWSDVLFVYERGLSHGRVPYLDSPFEYPPLVGGVSALFSIVLAGPVAFVAAWVIVCATAAAACAALVARSTPRWPLFAFAPQLLLLGTVNFDPLPTLFMTAAVVAQRAGADVRAAAFLALGTVAKLYPAASAPLGALRARRGRVFVAMFVAVVAAFYLPTIALPYSGARGVGFYAVGIRANVDSVWGIVERLLAGLGVPATSEIVVVATLVGLAATYLVFILPRARSARDAAVPIALATLAVLLWSRLYSPQYSLWVLPFLALLDVPVRRYVLLTVADIVVFFTVYPLTLVARTTDDTIGALLLAALAGSVVLRHFALWLVWRDIHALEARQ